LQKSASLTRDTLHKKELGLLRKRPPEILLLQF
jgi:hypothetical protein